MSVTLWICRWRKPQKRALHKAGSRGVSSVVVKLHHTRGTKVGDYADMLHREENSLTSRLVELKNTLEAWDDPIAPYSGDTKPISIDGGWTLDASVIIRQSYPLPMEVLMIARDVTVGGPGA